VAWGFQADNHVWPEPTPDHPDLDCKEVPCIDEDKLRRHISSDIKHPPAYCLRTFNCQHWCDNILGRSRK
jgi:hypothetical protein